MTWPLAVLAGLLVALFATLLAVHRNTRLRLRFLTAPESTLLDRHLAGQQTLVDLGPTELAYLRGAVVLVAGAGSSIAAELIRRLSTAGARSIVLLDNHENGLYGLRQSFLRSDPSYAERLHFELSNIRDEGRLMEVFRHHRPEVVFHFANYKSALLGNISPYAFVKVNVEGTRKLLDAASATPSVRRFVYVSSDKAHSASQTYGRTKLLGEMLVSSRAQRHPGIRFACIRYCNVLDASGSFAIPTFRRQIADGEKVTIRRFADGSIPDRYFIPIDVAAGLALYAGASAASGNVLSLDSARVHPLRIDELARLLARCSGVLDVGRWTRRNVEYVAAEPGEKRSEVLGTGRPVTGAPLVELSAAPIGDPELFDADVAELIRLTPELTVQQLHDRIREIVEVRRGEVAPVGPALVATAPRDRGPSGAV